jgi:alcohol dehydrogenase class IV
MTGLVSFGQNSASSLAGYLEENNPQSVLCIHGKASYAASGVKGQLACLLEKYKVTEWSDFSPNPEYNDLIAGLNIAHSCAPQLIIAAGGGSAIDMAKLIGIYCANGFFGPQLNFEDKNFENDSIPIAAIPTTAGSGSEATGFAVVWKDGEKFSISHPSMRPVLAVLNPAYLQSQPRYLMACAACDALSQAIESYWSVSSTAQSREFSADAMRLILPNLEFDGQNLSFGDLLMGSHLAGKAIDITKTGAPHAVSYAFTGCFGIPHGHAVALTLPSIFAYNCGVSDIDCRDLRGTEHVLQAMTELAVLLGTDSFQNAFEKLEGVIADMGLRQRLERLGVELKDIDMIAERGLASERMANNPRLLSAEALKTILLSLF